MTRQHTTCLPLVLVALIALLGACGSDNEVTSQPSSDCTVTSVTLGTIPRYMHTKTSAGADTTIKVTVVGGLYPLSIDQLNARIFNVDSLPVGTDISRVVFASFNSTGVVTIQSRDTKIDTTFTISDSTDFTNDRLFTVHAYDGVGKRTYSLHLNVHREAADTFRWQNELTGNATLQTLGGTPRLVTMPDGAVRLYGLKGTTPVVLSATTPGSWTETMLPADVDPATVTAEREGHVLYALTATGVVRSADGTTWTAATTAFRPDALLAVGTKTILALKDGHFWSSTDEGATWTQDEADEPDNIPVTNCRGTVVPSRTDNRLEDAVVVGRKADGTMAVWRRTLDLTATETFAWFYLNDATTGALACPDLTDPSLFTYDGTTLLTGLRADGTPAPIYQSRDNGRTWTDATIKPLGLTAAAVHRVAAFAGRDGFIRIADTATGELWKGRHNRLGWTDEQTSFERSRRK